MQIFKLFRNRFSQELYLEVFIGTNILRSLQEGWPRDLDEVKVLDPTCCHEKYTRLLRHFDGLLLILHSWSRLFSLLPSRGFQNKCVLKYISTKENTDALWGKMLRKDKVSKRWKKSWLLENMYFQVPMYYFHPPPINSLFFHFSEKKKPWGFSAVILILPGLW